MWSTGIQSRSPPCRPAWSISFFLSHSKSQSGPPAHCQHPDLSSPGLCGAAGREQTQSTHTAASWPRRWRLQPEVGWVCARSPLPAHTNQHLLPRPLPRQLREIQGKNGAPRIVITLQMNNALQGERGEKETPTLFLREANCTGWEVAATGIGRSLTSQAVKIPRKGHNRT